MGGNGIGRGPYEDLWARGFRHLLSGESMASSASDNLKICRFSEGSIQPLRWLGCAFRMRCRGSKPPRRNRCLSWWEARRPGRRPERNSLRGPSLGPQARPNRATARQGPDRLAQIARSGALRPTTMGSGLTRSQEATFTRKSFRCWLRRRRADFDPPYREATSATPANGARAEQPRRGRRSRSKAQAASMLRALTGEERNSSRSHCARDGHRFESPLLRSPRKPT
jgi:hypothetical protein